MAKFLGLFLFIAAFSVSCGAKDEKEIIIDNYYGESAYEELRQQKNQSFKNGDNSPLKDSDKKLFKGLNYYAPNKDFVFVALLQKNENPDTVTIKTTKADDIRTVIEYGKLLFEYGGKVRELTAYLSAESAGQEEKSFFVPFTDETCGKTSYEGGRYMDLEYIPGSKIYVLDFNLAYNPYCVYNKKYSCPLVPLQNHLAFEVEAGEKIIKKNEN